MGLFDFLKAKKRPLPTKTPIKANVSVTTHAPTANDLKAQMEERRLELRRLEDASLPSENGLKPHEIALLASSPRYKTSGNSFPKKWYYDYAIDNPQALLDKLLSKGFIRVASAQESLQSLKVTELKAILSEKAVKASGKKSDLISRILEISDEDELNRLIPVRQYALTPLGEREIRDNEYVAYFGASLKYGMTVWDMNRMLKNYPKKLYRNLIWEKLNEETQKAMERLQRSLDFQPYIYNRYQMCDFLMEEGKKWETAFLLLTEGTYYDFCLEEPYRFVALYRMYKQYGEQSGNTPPSFRVYIRKTQYYALKEKMGFSNEEMRESILRSFSRFSIPSAALKKYEIPKGVFSNDAIADFILAEIADDTEKADNICMKVESRLKNLR